MKKLFIQAGIAIVINILIFISLYNPRSDSMRVFQEVSPILLQFSALVFLIGASFENRRLGVEIKRLKAMRNIPSTNIPIRILLLERAPIILCVLMLSVAYHYFVAETELGATIHRWSPLGMAACGFYMLLLVVKDNKKLRAKIELLDFEPAQGGILVPSC